jgi:molybdenum cofactor cytidylyltransferase
MPTPALQPPAEPLVAVVLAAGLSRRMGRFKPLLPLGASTMIETVLAALRDSGAVEETIVVTGHEAPRLRETLAGWDVRLVHNDDYERGEMRSSVQCGVRALPAGAAFMLVLGDQPAVQPNTLKRLAKVWHETKADIVIPICHGRRGHPVVFSAACAEEVLQLAPHQTLRDLVYRRLEAARLVEVDDPAVTLDVDTPADFERALAQWRQTTQS